VDREKTPWLIVLMHAPLYNSNEAHYMEGESMRAVFESWFVHYKVDIVFAGHVHAYERSVLFFTNSVHIMLRFSNECDQNQLVLHNVISSNEECRISMVTFIISCYYESWWIRILTILFLKNSS